MNSLSKSYWSQRLAYYLAFLSSPHGLRRTLRISASQARARLGCVGLTAMFLIGASGLYLLIVNPVWMNRFYTFCLGVVVGVVLAFFYVRKNNV